MQGIAFGIIWVFTMDHISLQGFWIGWTTCSFTVFFFWHLLLKEGDQIPFSCGVWEAGRRATLISACVAGPSGSRLPESCWEQLLSPRASLVEVAWTLQLLNSSIVSVSERILLSILLLKPLFLTLCILVLVLVCVWNSLSRCCCEYQSCLVPYRHQDLWVQKCSLEWLHAFLVLLLPPPFLLPRMCRQENWLLK